MISKKDFIQYLKDYKNIDPLKLADAAAKVTEQYFGKTIELYIPIYISNFCNNNCAYCNFSASNNNIIRRRLSAKEISSELVSIKNKGFDDILILTGGLNIPSEFQLLIDTVQKAANIFARVGVEIFSCSVEQYKQLHNAGVAYVTFYQECYDRIKYKKYHISGPKADYDIRYSTPNTLLSAGIKGIGLGVLYGLADPITETIKLVEHLFQLRKKFWDREYSVSFPRIKDRNVAFTISDDLFVKIIYLFRLLFPDITLNLSTRETPELRDKLLGFGINKISAESSTIVGGYLDKSNENNGQFKLFDKRNIDDIIRSIKKNGFQPVFKNYDPVLV